MFSELIDLSDRIEKLAAFLRVQPEGVELTLNQRALLELQLKHMGGYQVVLTQRVQALG
jgi:hypothetical protein